MTVASAPGDRQLVRPNRGSFSETALRAQHPFSARFSSGEVRVSVRTAFFMPCELLDRMFPGGPIEAHHTAVANHSLMRENVSVGLGAVE